jgi:hypothetical protein
MLVLLHALLWSAAALTCAAFQPHLLVIPVGRQGVPTASTSKLFVMSELLPNAEERECLVPPDGPATVFGRPIQDDDRERNRAFIKGCKSLLFDTLFQGQELTRSYARFYALENIARMPYFSYLSVLHLYESLGWWRRSEYLKGEYATMIPETASKPSQATFPTAFLLTLHASYNSAL